MIEELSKELGLDFSKSKNGGLYAKKENLFLLKPQTYMNLSGSCVSDFANFFKINSEDILVIYDDVYLPTGKIRFRDDGSSGGHNGIKDIIEKLGTTKFKRLRIGIKGKEEFSIKK
jgi:PTH1 family peptidyl-tRNA hydrolase